MTDYKEEQENEIEALESIYPDELEVLSTEPFHSFQISVGSQCERDEVENASCILQFTYTATYPDEPPVSEIKEYENIEEEHVETLQELMKEQAEENLGMGMIFTLVSAVQEKLTDIVESVAEAKIEAEERKKQEAEEAERKRFEGIQVTIETFLAWKAKFEAEMQEEKRRQGKLDGGKSAKLTGKELFMSDHTLDDSDVKFLESEGDTVAVDESLFQDLEDLDLEDDDQS